MPGGWQGDAIDAFTGAGLTITQKEAQDFLKKLLNWRKNTPVIHHGKLMHFAPEKGTYTYVRYDDKKKVMVIINKNKVATEIGTARFHEMLAATATATDILSGKKFDLSKAINLPARSVLVLEID